MDDGEREPTRASEVRRCCEILREALWSLLDSLTGVVRTTLDVMCRNSVAAEQTPREQQKNGWRNRRTMERIWRRKR